MKVPQKPPRLSDLLNELNNEGQSKIVEVLGSDLGSKPVGTYVHWEELRHLPLPNGFAHRQWWLAIKMSRRAVYRLPFADSQRTGFNYSVPDTLFKLLHEIDRDASGRIEVAELVTSSQTRDRYLVYFVQELKEELGDRVV